MAEADEDEINLESLKLLKEIFEVSQQCITFAACVQIYTVDVQHSRCCTSTNSTSNSDSINRHNQQ
jgi:hypothetical protein